VKELERAVTAARNAGPTAGAARARAQQPPPPKGPPPRDPLDELRAKMGSTPGSSGPVPPKSTPPKGGKAAGSVDDELAALKKKMEQTKGGTPKKGP
jgi:hypothetical protein